jgi:hypothetical protein
MNQPINSDPTNQQARDWSERLGQVAAENATAPAAVPTHISAILNLLRQRNRTRQHVEHNLHANNFIMAD